MDCLAQLALLDKIVDRVGPLSCVRETGRVGCMRLDRFLGMRGKVRDGNAQINDSKDLAPSSKRGRLHRLVTHLNVVGQLQKGPVATRALVVREAIHKTNDVLGFVFHSSV